MQRAALQDITDKKERRRNLHAKAKARMRVRQTPRLLRDYWADRHFSQALDILKGLEEEAKPRPRSSPGAARLRDRMLQVTK